MSSRSVASNVSSSPSVTSIPPTEQQQSSASFMPAMKQFIESIWDELVADTSGQKAQYIPELAEANEDLLAVCVCDLNGEVMKFGDTEVRFSIQSCVKPFIYAAAMQSTGIENVHKYVGQEPSGQRFNAFCLGSDSKPHNPMINTGAIVTTSLILPREDLTKRFKHLKRVLEDLTGQSEYVGFDNSVYLSEKATADRNRSLLYFMREHNCFPEGTSMNKTLELYLQYCSIQVTATVMAKMASTLANGGVNPLTRRRVVSSQAVKNVCAIMYLCGMYDGSGRFAFEVGIPGKSGVSGAVFLVLQGVCGICIWSPRLDERGNSARAMKFCQLLIERFPQLHMFERVAAGQKRARTLKTGRLVREYQLGQAAAEGNIERVRELLSNTNVNSHDALGRTPLHVAASARQHGVMKLLIASKGDMTIRDNEGNTPASNMRLVEQLFRDLAGIQRPAHEDSSTIDLSKLLLDTNDGVSEDQSPLQEPQPMTTTSVSRLRLADVLNVYNQHSPVTSPMHSPVDDDDDSD